MSKVHLIGVGFLHHGRYRKWTACGKEIKIRRRGVLTGTDTSIKLHQVTCDLCLKHAYRRAKISKEGRRPNAK